MKNYSALFVLLFFFLNANSLASENSSAPIFEKNFPLSNDENVSLINDKRMAEDKILTPLQWLKNMQEAHKKQNYGLYFIHHSPNGLESFRYYHSFFDGKNYAQLTHLEGIQHEVVLKNKHLIYFTPHEPAYSLAVDHMVDKLPLLLNVDLETLKTHYEILPMGLNRIANRLVRTFRFVPKDSFRYQLLLFVDAKEHWLLRQDILDKTGNILEQFRALHIVPLFDPENFVKSLEPFDIPTLLTQLNPHYKNSKVITTSPRWKPNWLPQGFKLIEQRQRLDGENIIETQFYSDGLFSFTINLAPSIIPNATEKTWTNGAMTLCSQSLENQDITIVGEIPLSTAKRIISEMVFQK